MVGQIFPKMGSSWSGSSSQYRIFSKALSVPTVCQVGVQGFEVPEVRLVRTEAVERGGVIEGFIEECDRIGVEFAEDPYVGAEIVVFLELATVFLDEEFQSSFNRQVGHWDPVGDLRQRDSGRGARV